MVEGTAFETRQGLKPLGGSNPPASAKIPRASEACDWLILREEGYLNRGDAKLGVSPSRRVGVERMRFFIIPNLERAK